MKRFICVFIIIFVLMLSSCSQGSDPVDELSIPLKITAKLDGSDVIFTTAITEQESNVTFDESHSLSGTELHFSEDGNTAKSGDFQKQVKNGTFPAQEAFIKAIRLLNGKDVLPTDIENGKKYTIDEMTIMVYYDKDTKQLTGIGTEENGRRFDFIIVGREPYEVQGNGEGQS